MTVYLSHVPMPVSVLICYKGITVSALLATSGKPAPLISMSAQCNRVNTVVRAPTRLLPTHVRVQWAMKGPIARLKP
jgi:hypothetical protein